MDEIRAALGLLNLKYVDHAISVICLPVYADLKEEDVERICDLVKSEH